MNNKLTIAAAGSGKTTNIISEALKQDTPVLITTYTESNAEEIKKKFISRVGYIPENISILTWFSLLIKHGVKPYQNMLFDERVKGMILCSQQSGFRYNSPKGFPIYWAESNFFKHYFTKEMKIYSDKLSKLVIKIDQKTSGKVVRRLVNIFPNIFIDESQDLAGYDLDIVKLISLEAKLLRLVCDPRQVTYLTHHEAKYRKYRNGNIENFIECECKKTAFEIDSKTLATSYRSNQEICDFANKLYPNLSPMLSNQNVSSGHDGIFFIKKFEVEEYLQKFNPVQLRWNIKVKTHSDYQSVNFGESKGLTFDRVLIYPTKPMIEWLNDNNYKLKAEARAKFYVAITRAKYSVGMIID